MATFKPSQTSRHHFGHSFYQSNKNDFCSIILTLEVPWVNRIDFQALNLVGPTGTSLLLDPLTVLHLDKWLKISPTSLLLHFYQPLHTFDCVAYLLNILLTFNRKSLL